MPGLDAVSLGDILPYEYCNCSIGYPSLQTVQNIKYQTRGLQTQKKLFAICWTSLSLDEGRKWEIQGKGIRERRKCTKTLQGSTSSPLLVSQIQK